MRLRAIKTMILAVALVFAGTLLLGGTGWAGLLTVKINPPEAARGGGVWTVDYGKTWFKSGQTLDLPAGRYVVGFMGIPGWRTPREYNLELGERVRSTIEAEYSRLRRGAELKVVLDPPEVARMGAAWSIDNGETWHPGGSGVSLPAGTYTIIFNSQGGWATPQPMTVTLGDGESVEIGSTYGTIITGPSGVLRVNIRPAEAVKAGAQWSVDAGHTWFLHNSGLRLEPGEYRITFKDITGWRSPLPRKVIVKKDKETKDYATYQRCKA